MSVKQIAVERFSVTSSKPFDEIVKALELPEVKDRIVKLGGDPTSLTPAEFDARLRQEIETNAVIVRAGGLKAP